MMKITNIELAGTSETTLHDGTPGLPRAFARISRKNGDEFITVEILTTGGEDAGDRKHKVQADDDGDQWSMAEILQETLDGCRGTNSDIDGYFRTIRMLGD